MQYLQFIFSFTKLLIRTQSDGWHVDNNILFEQEAGLSNPGGPEMQSDDQPPPYQANYGTSDNVPPRPVGNTSDPPPSYDSLYGELKAAKTESTGFLDFVKKFVIIVLSTSKFLVAAER